MLKFLKYLYFTAFEVFQFMLGRIPSDRNNMIFNYILLCFMARQPLFGQGLLTVEASRSHSDTPHLLVLPWTIDQSDAETTI